MIDGYSLCYWIDQYLFRMQIKAKYQNKNKRLNSKSISGYQTLRAALKKAFPAAPENFVIYYFHDDEDCVVENDDDYQLMMDSFPQKLTIYIRGEDEDPVDTANTSSVMKSEFMNDSTREVVGVVAEPNKTDFIKGREKVLEQEKLGKKVEESQEKILAAKLGSEESEVKKQKPSAPVVIVKKQEVLAQVPSPSKLVSTDKKQVPVKKQQIKQSSVPPKVEAKMKEEQIEYQPSTSNFVHKGVKCSACGTVDIKGSRWKCLSCLDFDLCHDCYCQGKYKTGKQHKGKQHEFSQIEDDTFWTRLNFSHSIRKLFNPDYKIDENDNVIGEWISEEDINRCGQNFVNEVWRCSQPIARKIIQDFEKWQGQYESLAMKQ